MAGNGILNVSKSRLSSIELLIAIQSEMQKMYHRLLETAKGIKDEKMILLTNLPYHINLIDELHINENAHSRILAKLLQYHDANGRYVILESLVDYIKSKGTSEEFRNIEIQSPCVTQEKGRIDLWVRDYTTKYSLIFENKIYDAIDQSEQLYRYIEKTRRCDFEDKGIFVLYLTKFGNEPSPQAWGDERTYKEFHNRFMALSFRKDIIFWLKTAVLPIIHQKDDYLRSAVTQYIDYLEGLFNIRENEETMNKAIKKIISEKLDLTSVSDPNERYQIIEDTLEDIETLKSSLIDIKYELFKERIPLYAKQWKSDFIVPSSKFQIHDDYANWEDNIIFGVKFQCDGKPTHIVIGVENYDLFCQVQRDCAIRSKKLTKQTLSIYSLVKKFLSGVDRESIYIYQYFEQDFDEVYNTFCRIVQAVNREI